MKASRLIRLLEEAMDSVGDAEVIIPCEAQPIDDEDLFSAIVSVAHFKQGSPIILCDKILYETYRA